MQRRAVITFADFLLRFTVLAALTVAVLASVAISASRDEPQASGPALQEVPDTAAAVNDRRYPMVYGDAAPQR